MALNRAYSLLEIKSVDEDARIIEGVATTPKTDRMEDIVEPMGGEYVLPLPFLWMHDSKESPVGHVIAAAPTDAGIPVRIQIERDDQPGILKDRLDYAWRSIQKKLVRGLSIGFAPIEAEPIKGTFGMRYKRWSWLELSAVTIPANADASIALVKSIDSSFRAASGHTEPEPTKSPPGASGSVKMIPIKARGATKMNIKDQITGFENTRAAKAAQRAEIQEKASKEGRSKDAAESEEFDTLTRELASIDKELVDLATLEKEVLEKAVPVSGNGSEEASKSRGPSVRFEPEEKLEKGIEFARYAMCVAAAKGDLRQALDLAVTHYPQQKRAINVLKAATGRGSSVEKLVMQQKAAVAAGTTTDATWAEPLLAYNTFAGDFIEYLRPRTIIGQFGQNGVPDLRRVPFNVHIKGQTSGGTGYWVGEGKPKPVTKFDFNDTYHGFTKVAAIAVLTEELIRFSDPSAERLVREALADTLIARIDVDFIDPAKGASAGVSPASITNGVSATTASGLTADDVRADLQTLWAAGVAANLPLTSAVYITTPSIALALSLMMNSLGSAREFDKISMSGGTLLGVPVIVSNHVKPGDLILAYASEIFLSDDGSVTVDASREASLQMLDNPTNDSDTPTPTTVVSMYQTDSVALRAHRFINWSKRRSQAVAYIGDAGYGGAVAS